MKKALRTVVLASFLLGIVSLVLAGCHTSAPPDLPGLRHRGSIDLRCQAVTMQDLGRRTQLVRGCGQEAVYVQMCQTGSNSYGSWDTNCTWLLNRGPSPLAGPASPAG